MGHLPPPRVRPLLALAALALLPPSAFGTSTINCTSGGTIVLSSDATMISGGASCTGTVAIPETVTTIAASTFQNATGLESIRLPAGLTTIGANAFRGATGLTSIAIPRGVSAIGYSVFLGATGLRSVTFATPSSMTAIGNAAFFDATELRSITIPAGVTSIAYDAFGSRMDRVYFTGDAPTIPGGVAQFFGLAQNAVAFRYSTASGFGTGAQWRGFALSYWMPTPAAPRVVAGDQVVTTHVDAVLGGPPPLGYTVTAVEDTSKSCTITGPTGTCVVRGLDNGRAYTFTATAFDAHATSAPSVASDAATPTAPAAPAAQQESPGAQSSIGMPLILRGISTTCRGVVCTTRGLMPDGATAVNQAATRRTRGSSVESARPGSGARKVRCAIGRKGAGPTAARTYTCRLTLPRGDWRIATTATGPRGAVVGRAVVVRRLR